MRPEFQAENTEFSPNADGRRHEKSTLDWPLNPTICDNLPWTRTFE